MTSVFPPLSSDRLKDRYRDSDLNMAAETFRKGWDSIYHSVQFSNMT